MSFLISWELKKKKIEDYLFHFGIYSPDRIAADEAYLIAKAEPPTDEEIERMVGESEEFDKRQFVESEEYQKENKTKKMK
ncbi:MAG: hypothetical protein LRY73_02955 [Bacillus sp. (in: Bacteria)]|nr:hypothetical protein [Bacillus sp. (in: firmicutes)]